MTGRAHVTARGSAIAARPATERCRSTSETAQMDPVNYQVAGMMRWHQRAVNAVAVLLSLLLLFLVLEFVVEMFASSANSFRSLDLVPVLVLGPIGVLIIVAAGWLIICWAVTSWRVFRAGQVGFG